MPESPITNKKTDLISYEVSIGGRKVLDKYQLLSMNVEKQLNKVPFAEIVYLDGDASKQKFEMLEDLAFKTGEDIIIKAGYHSQLQIIFKGILTAIRVNTKHKSHPKLILECSDKAIAMTRRRRYESFDNKKDSDVCRQIVDEYGLNVQVSATITTHEEIIQYGATDWDFILSRAEACERVVFVNNNEFKFIKPASGSQNNMEVTFGVDFHKLDLTIDSRFQHKEFSTHAWKFSDHKMISEKGQDPSYVEKNGNGTVKGKAIATKIKMKDAEVHVSTPITSPELKAISASHLLKSRLSKIRGTIITQGFQNINPNDYITIKQVNSYYDGDAYVSGVNQILEDGNYTTEITIGLDPEFYINKKKDISLASGDSLLPGVNGLFTGIVLQIHGDPQNEFRVKVKIPSISPQHPGVWARYSSLMASVNSGSMFLPEVNDEVILGAIGGDMRFPVILGQLYSKKHSPVKKTTGKGPSKDHNIQPKDKNPTQAIVTKDHLRLVFENDKKNIKLETPGGQVVHIKDEGKCIILEDVHKNKMVMDSSGFKFTTKKNFEVNADGNISFTTKKNVTTKASMGKINSNAKDIVSKASMKYNATGMTLDMKANTKGSLKAGAAVEVSASGITTIKGSVVKLN